MVPGQVEIAIKELVVGQPLVADIIDPTGRVLLKRGHILSQGVIDRWYAHGFQKVLMLVSDGVTREALEDARQLRPYDEAFVREVDLFVDQSKSAIEQMLVDLVVNDQPQLEALQSILSQIANALRVDSDAVIAKAYQEMDQPGATSNEHLINRSVTLSTLAAATADQMGMSERDQLTIALAGALHDVALFEETQALLLGDNITAAQRAAHYMRHGDLSGELLGNCREVSIQVRIIISQVHEQVDGSGFPKGLNVNLLSMHSRILNLVDAYLTLIDPTQRQTFVPADALAYLVRQTTRGAFDLECMRGLLRAISIYPVGSGVLLSDDRTATVLRSTRSDPMRPIVRIEDERSVVVDLRRSNHYIKEPAVDLESSARRRIRRSELDTILWQPRAIQRFS